MKRFSLFLVVILPCLFYPPNCTANTTFSHKDTLWENSNFANWRRSSERIYNFNADDCLNCGLVSSASTMIEPPIANAVGGILHCSGQMELNGYGSTQGDNISYYWSTNNGSIIAGDNSLTPTIDKAGRYTLLVVDNDSQMSSSFSVEVLAATGVEAGDPILYCEDELPLDFTLDGKIYGPHLDFYWSNSPNLVDPTILNPIVFATPEETHRLNAEVLSGVNLIVNGNFESGNTNFYSQYLYGTDVAGKYLVTDNPQDFYNGFAACGDRTTGWGNMMVLDGSGLPNQKVWCQEVAVTQNTTYAFSAWFQNVCATCLWGQPIIDFKVNGISLGTVQKTGDGCIWEKFSSFWDSSNNLTAEFCLYTNELDPIGNDFAIDDIEVLASCIMADEVDVKFDDITANFEYSSLSCDVSEVNLISNPSGTDVSNISYTWSTDEGEIVEGQNTSDPLVQGDGLYRLRITNENTSCYETLDFILEGDFTEPDISAVAPILTCSESEALVEGSSQTEDVSYYWTTQDGNIISGENEQNALINVAGVYYLEVTNNQTGCSSSVEILVEADLDVQEVSILQPDNISCHEQVVTLETDLDQEDFTFFWTSIEGNILDGEYTDVASVDVEGIYVLTVTNNENGCTRSAEIEVSSVIQIPDLNLGETQTLRCGDESATLSVGSAQDNTSFKWYTESGSILSDNNLENIEVGASGFYNVVVTDLNNGCTAEGIIEVINDTQAPFVDIGDQKELTCRLNSVNLDASNSETGDHLTYRWTTVDGNILTGLNSLTPRVDQPGTYELQITNTLNLCETRSRVRVIENKEPPTADAGIDKVINCFNESVILGREFFTDTEMEFYWSTIDGEIGGDADKSIVQANSPGTYSLRTTKLDNGCSSLDEVTVGEDIIVPSLTLESESANVTCAANKLEIQSSTEIQDLSYLWDTMDGLIISDPEEEQIVVGYPGIYELTITDQNNGCTNAESLEIFGAFDLPEIEILEPQPFICGTEKITVTALNLNNEEDLDIQWSTLDGQINSSIADLTINVSAPGEYTLIATNNNSGCAFEKSISVTEDTDQPELQLYSDEILTCARTEVEVRSESIVEGLLYNWTSSSGNIISDNAAPNILVNTAGTYILEVINPINNCSSVNEIDVFADIGEPIILIDEPETLTCDKPAIILDASLFSNSSIFNVTWTTQDGNIVDGGTTLTPTVNEPGVYTLFIENMANQCASSQTITVEQNIDQPNAQTIQGELLTCALTQTEIGVDIFNTDDYNFEWNTLMGQIVSDGSQPGVYVDQAGVYNVVVTDKKNGCTQALAIDVLQDIVQPNIDAGNDFEIDCDFVSQNLTGAILENGNFESNWFTTNGNIIQSKNSLEPEVDQAGLYYLEVLNLENGCSSIDSLLVSKNQNVPTDILTSIEPPLCFGDRGNVSIIDIVGGEGPYLYNLNLNGFQPDSLYESLIPGQEYQLVIQDVNGCEKDTSFIIPTVPNLQLNLIPEIDLIIGDSHDIYVQTNIPEETIDQIVWSPATYLSCDDCLNPRVQPLSDQLYEVVITTENGCIEKAQILFKVDRDIKVYAPNAFTPFDGNGINDRFHLFSAENTVKNISEFRIFDRWGNEVFARNNVLPNDENNGWDGKFNNKNASLGVYVWQAKIEFITGDIMELEGDVTLLY